MTTMTVAELIEKLRHAATRMSRKNPHRLLLVQCEDALVQLANKVGEPSCEQRDNAGTAL